MPKQTDKPETRYAADAENETLAAALKYAKRGWPVFPLWGRDDGKCDCGDANCKNPGKHPIGSLAPHGFKNATTDPKVIERWWRKHPDAGIGLVTGNASGLIVIDVDIKNKNPDRHGWAALGLLEAELGRLPEPKIASTPSGGRHYYFRYAEGIRSSTEKLGPGLDIKAEGGFVVAPPSHGLYDWVDGRPAPDLPAAWVAHLTSLTATGTAGAKATADAFDIAAALKVIPNDDVSWEEWNRVAMAAWRATGGCEEGFAAFDSWSSKSSKYDADTTRKRWDGFKTSPPTIIGAGTIFWLADRTAPGWRQKKGAVDLEHIAARVEELAKLDGVAYALARKAAGKELGIDLKTLDAEVMRVRAESAEEVPLYDHWNVEPWPKPVDTDDLLLAIQDEITRYVATLGDRAIVPALWVMFTWIHKHARHSPMLLVNSAEPDCGKTTLLSVISYLAWKPLTSVEISGPMLYRSIEKWHPTFIIDEADAVLEHNDDLRAVINSGWTRGQGVIRGAPETHEPEMFSTFAPKALGMKGRDLPATTLSRCIELTLKRKLPDEKVADFKYEDDKHLAELRSKLARWAADNGEALGRAKPQRIPGFANRLWMNWRPLLAIAELASEEAVADVIKAAQEIESAKRGDTLSLSTQLLEDIRELFDAEKEDELLSRVIVEALVADAEKPWAQLTKGKPLTQNRLAKMLRPFGIISEEVHPEVGRGAAHGKGYKRERFEEAWERYLSRAAEKPGPKARDRAKRDET
jgi:hypothetical protein